MNKNLLFTAALCLVLLCSCHSKKSEVCGENIDTTSGNEMVYRSLGNTGLKVSEIGIGCSAFEKLDSTESRLFMDIALTNGINYMDLWTSDPLVRDHVGYALQGRRDQMMIQGHIGAYWNGEQHEQTRDLKKCKEGFEDLLTRLGTDFIDIGMIHIVDSKEDWDAIKDSPYMNYVKQLKEEGKIKHIGMSSHNAEVAYEAVQSGIVEVLMLSVNPAFDLLPADLSAWDAKSYDKSLTNIDTTRTKLYNYCAEKGIAITVMKAFGGGRLLDATQSPLGIALTTDQCLEYALTRPAVATVVCGAKTTGELMQDLRYLTASDEDKDFSSALSSAKKACWKGDCIYCGHCAPCPAGIDIDKVNKLLSIAKMYDVNEIPQNIRDEYEKLEHYAGECTECGGCESRCPFGVPVRENMKEAKRVFGK